LTLIVAVIIKAAQIVATVVPPTTGKAPVTVSLLITSVLVTIADTRKTPVIVAFLIVTTIAAAAIATVEAPIFVTIAVGIVLAIAAVIASVIFILISDF
jgi:hypothetical protein